MSSRHSSHFFGSRIAGIGFSFLHIMQMSVRQESLYLSKIAFASNFSNAIFSLLLISERNPECSALHLPLNSSSVFVLSDQSCNSLLIVLPDLCLNSNPEQT